MQALRPRLAQVRAKLMTTQSIPTLHEGKAVARRLEKATMKE